MPSGRASPPLALNVAGLEELPVRAVAAAFGERFGREARFTGREAVDALLSNGRQAAQLLGPPRVSVDQMIDWIADWVARGGAALGKPTHFEVRDGRF